MRFTTVCAAWIAAALFGCNAPPPSATTDAATDVAPPCADGAALCEARCVDTASSVEHCGACGNHCVAGQACVAGACTCAAGATECGSACVDTASSASHCGACFNACAAGQSCVAGACVFRCDAPRSTCGELGAQQCVDLRSDEAHCGACDNACAADQRCESGACACASGERACGGRCVDLQSDDAHCGACGNVCAAGQRCVAGACACDARSTRCGSGAGASCRDLQSDSANCGACGAVCAAGTLCAAGACVASCGGVAPNRCASRAGAFCTDVQTDSANCGRCGNACRGNATCAAGVCAPSNDTPASAIELAFERGVRRTVEGSTLGASDDEAACAGASHTVFYRIALRERSIVYVDTFGSGLNTVVGFRRAADEPTSACSDDACATTQSQSVIVADAGALWIEVGSVGAAGSFALRYTIQPAGGGDVSAFDLRAPSVIEGSTAGQRDGFSARCDEGASGPEDALYATTCPGDASAVFHASSCGSRLDTVLELRSVGAAPVCNDDVSGSCGAGSSVSSQLPAGAGLHVLYVDGAAPGAGDTYRLESRFQGCALGFELCSGFCMPFDRYTSERNCGGCGIACADGERCIQGACGAPTIRYGVLPSQTPYESSIVGTSMGVLERHDCLENEALVGFRYTGGESSAITSIQPLCAPLVVTGRDHNRVFAGAITAGPVRGVPTGRTRDSVCPVGFVVTGTLIDNAPAIQQFELRCSRLDIASEPTRPLIVTRQPDAIAAVGDVRSTAQFATTCKPGQYASGTMIRAAQEVHAIGFRCVSGHRTSRFAIDLSAEHSVYLATFPTGEETLRQRCPAGQALRDLSWNLSPNYGRPGARITAAFGMANPIGCARIVGTEPTERGTWRFQLAGGSNRSANAVRLTVPARGCERNSLLVGIPETANFDRLSVSPLSPIVTDLTEFEAWPICVGFQPPDDAQLFRFDRSKSYSSQTPVEFACGADEVAVGVHFTYPDGMAYFGRGFDQHLVGLDCAPLVRR